VTQYTQYLWKLPNFTTTSCNPTEQVAGRVQISQRPWLCSIPALEITGGTADVLRQHDQYEPSTISPKQMGSSMGTSSNEMVDNCYGAMFQKTGG